MQGIFLKDKENWWNLFLVFIFIYSFQSKLNFFYYVDTRFDWLIIKKNDCFSGENIRIFELYFFIFNLNTKKWREKVKIIPIQNNINMNIKNRFNYNWITAVSIIKNRCATLNIIANLSKYYFGN